MANLGYLKELGEEFAVGAGVGLIYGGGRTVIDKIDNAIESKKTPFEEKQKLAQEKETILANEENITPPPPSAGMVDELQPQENSGITLAPRLKDVMIYDGHTNELAASIEKKIPGDYEPSHMDLIKETLKAKQQGDQLNNMATIPSNHPKTKRRHQRH